MKFGKTTGISSGFKRTSYKAGQRRSQTARKRQTHLTRFRERFLKTLLPIAVIVVFIGFYGLISLIPKVAFSHDRKSAAEYRGYTCPQFDETGIPTSQYPLSYSPNYMNSIHAQLQNKANLVSNADLKELSEDASHPSNFFISSSDPDVTYAYGNEDSQRYLHVAATNISQIKPSWIMQSIPVLPKQTYGYSFEYRSTAESEITLEVTSDNGTVSYVGLDHLLPSEGWASISGHLSTDSSTQSIRVIVSLLNTGSLDTRAYQISQIASAQLSHPIISFAFDDGWESVYTKAYPALKQYGYTASVFVITKYSVESTPQYMNVEQLKTLQNDGYEIGSHSLKHCNLTELNSTDLAYDMETSKNLLQKAGLSVDSFAHPFGKYSEATVAEAAQNFTYIRSSDSGLNDRYFDPHHIRVQTVLADTSEETVRAWIEAAKSDNAWLILLYHRFDESGEYSTATDQLQSHLTMIKSSGIEVLPIAQAARSIEQ